MKHLLKREKNKKIPNSKRYRKYIKDKTRTIRSIKRSIRQKEINENIEELKCLLKFL